jgi:hypothetical protein
MDICAEADVAAVRVEAKARVRRREVQRAGFFMGEMVLP